jgi:membrane carboxypeptidase/penicillin-binding protein
VIDSIERDGNVVYRFDTNTGMTQIKSVDQVAFYQLKTMMQGVLARGTARAIADFAPYVAGKTGTSDEENDAWFVGFSNDVTVAVWIGYDNAGNKRRTLGGGATGGGVAVPIFEPVMRAVWNDFAPRTALAPPSPEAKRQLSCKAADRTSSECLRTDDNGKVIDTINVLASAQQSSPETDGRAVVHYVRHERSDERPRRSEQEPARQKGAHRNAGEQATSEHSHRHAEQEHSHRHAEHEHSHRHASRHSTTVARQSTPSWGFGSWFASAFRW